MKVPALLGCLLAYLHASTSVASPYDFIQHNHRVMEGSLFGYNELPSFGLLTFDTKASDPFLTYEIVNIDGKVQNALTVRLSQLGKPAP